MKSFLFQNVELANLIVSIYKTKLPVPVSRKIMAITISFDLGADNLKKGKDKLMEEYAVRDEKGEISVEGGRFAVSPEKADEYTAKLQELLDCDYKMPQLQSSDLDALPDLSAKDLKLLLDAGLIPSLDIPI